MATALTNMFGSELIVSVPSQIPQKTYTGFSGANGMTLMNHGFRGYVVRIRGVIRVSGATYALAHVAANAAVNTIAATQAYTEADYTYAGSTYANATFTNFRTFPRLGKDYLYDAAKQQMTVAFEITMIGLTN